MKRIVFASWSLLSLALFIGRATAQETHSLYEQGHFPAGLIYTENDIPKLVGKTFTQPAYLVGQFMYKGEFGDRALFGNFSARELLESGNVAFGNDVIAVRFFSSEDGRTNRPFNLEPLKALAPFDANPLVIRRILLANDGIHLVVDAECWSTP
jgi:hypothetical protein